MTRSNGSLIIGNHVVKVMVHWWYFDHDIETLDEMVDRSRGRKWSVASMIRCLPFIPTIPAQRSISEYCQVELMRDVRFHSDLAVVSCSLFDLGMNVSVCGKNSNCVGGEGEKGGT